MENSKPQLAVSSWSLNRTLGAPQFDALKNETKRAPQEGAVSLLELPQKVADFGIYRLELCHFHLPQADDKYLQMLREALEVAGVELWDLLIDDGDISHPQDGPMWVEWTKSWIDIASQLGARHVRIIAGKQEATPENLERARDNLQVLAEYAKAKNVRVLTENWFALLDKPSDVLWLLDELDGQIGLNFDFGNWSGERKYEDLPQIAARAESSHTKCRFDGTQADETDFRRCLQMLKDVNFAGSHSLIYDGADSSEWTHLATERAIVLEYL